MQTEHPVLTVSELNRSIRNTLENFGSIAVQGELSNVVQASSGHYYFTLKDKQAQIRCAFFKNRHIARMPKIIDGQQVIARGQLSIYESRGDYQLIIDAIEEAGIGALYRAFQLLKTKLEALGLFESSRKKPLPPHIQRIAVITSPIGAALHDIMSTIQRRHPLAETHLYPSEVQGAVAATQLIQAIEKANQEKRCDVIILARGGGSLEDLWSFNDEALAYAIVNSTIPIITGIGHETDFTIADFVADYRAATPTAAAEKATPDWQALVNQFTTLYQRLQQAITRLIQNKQQNFQFYLQQLSSPKRQINMHAQTLDYLTSHLKKTINIHLQQKQQHYHLITQMLHTLSPLNTLNRGYAIAIHHQQVLTHHEKTRIGDTLELQLKVGKLQCQITKDISDA